MYAFDRQRYLKLQAFEPPLRHWTRLWLDGLNSGTHIHWRLSPLSLLGLAKTWRYLSCLDRWGPQQAAIINMVERRRQNSSYRGQIPSSGSGLQQWHDFLAKQVDEQAQSTSDALSWHRQRIADSTLDTASHIELWAALSELFAVLALRGFSTDDLSNRVKDGVIDVSDLRGGTAAERLLGFLDYFSNTEPRTYVVWTKVVTDTEWSNTTCGRFSRIRLDHSWDLMGEGPARIFLQEGESRRPAIVSKIRGTHSVKERHRLQAIQELEKAMRAGSAFGTLSLDATTQMVLSDQPERAPLRYSRKRYAVPLLSSEDHSDDALRVGRAAQELFDHPERVIDEVFRVFEHSGDAEYWEQVPRSYHRLLRTDLGFSVNAYRQRLHGVFKKCRPDAVPPATRLVCDVSSIKDHSELLKRITDVAPDEDAVIATRLEEIVRWPHFDASLPQHAKAYNSVHEIVDLLTISKGFRNALAHSRTILFDIYHVAVYLATVMLYVYSCYKRDERRAVHVGSSAGG